MRMNQSTRPRTLGARLSVLGSVALALAVGVAREAPADLTTELVASGLIQPLFATYAPGDADRLFIVEQPGVIRILDIASDPPALLTGNFLDIQHRRHVGIGLQIRVDGRG